MRYNIFVHGVPQGHDSSCDEKGVDETIYFESFYKTGSKCETKLVVAKKNNFYYYSYLVYKYNGKEILDYINRHGSYFGITLRFDRFYKNIILIYRILESCYQVLVFNKILEVSIGGLKYKVEKFIDSRSDLEELYSFISSQLNRCLNSQDFIDLNSLTIVRPPITLNLLEYDNIRLLDILQNEKGILDLSLYYPTKEFEDITRKLKGDSGRISELEKVVSEKEIKISSLESQLLLIKEEKSKLEKDDISINSFYRKINEINKEFNKICCEFENRSEQCDNIGTKRLQQSQKEEFCNVPKANNGKKKNNNDNYISIHNCCSFIASWLSSVRPFNKKKPKP